ncbi:MAG: autotransporter outer membrane beta-barrel domain-containing protein [Pseudomonadota bacterium]
MKFTKSASALAFVAMFAGTAEAQSLSDAINTALANECSALGGSTPRYTDTWQYQLSTDTIDFTSTDPALTAQTLNPIITVQDGVGRFFEVRQSTVTLQDPAVAAAMTEAEIAALFEQSGVQRLVIDRFAAGAFGAGLGGLCQTIVEARTNTNGNTAGSGGFAGGSSSASGRSVSSLSSARNQASENKKRKKRKKERDASIEGAYIRLASADGGVGVISDAAGVGPFGVRTTVDLRGGYTDLNRDATALEGGFDGHSTWGQGALTAEFSRSMALAGSFAYQRSKGEFNGSNASGGANEFRDRSYSGALYAIWSAPIGAGDTSLDLSVGGFYGRGSGSIERTFSTLRAATYFVDVTDPLLTVDTIRLDRQTFISDDLLGEYDTRNHGFSAAASMSFDMGGIVVTPGVEYTRFTFKQDAYNESATDAFDNGLALSYSRFKDKWSETRIGGALSRTFDAGPFGLRVEAYGDLVLVGNAATPTRTATFAQDLRAQPYTLSYRVDDLDKAFARFGVLGAVGISDGVELFVGGETNAAHDYLHARSVFAGVRFTP